MMALAQRLFGNGVRRGFGRCGLHELGVLSCCLRQVDATFKQSLILSISASNRSSITRRTSARGIECSRSHRDAELWSRPEAAPSAVEISMRSCVGSWTREVLLVMAAIIVSFRLNCCSLTPPPEPDEPCRRLADVRDEGQDYVSSIQRHASARFASYSS